MDLSPLQVFSVATAMIPFLENDDANRALMGANMQRQAVPLVRPQVPLVKTGIERRAANDSGAAIASDIDGIVQDVTAKCITIHGYDGDISTFTAAQLCALQPGDVYSPSADCRERRSASKRVRRLPTGLRRATANWRLAAT